MHERNTRKNWNPIIYIWFADICTYFCVILSEGSYIFCRSTFHGFELPEGSNFFMHISYKLIQKSIALKKTN